MANVYYVGDWALAIGPLYAESPFNCGHKGAEVFNDSTWLKTALESSGEHRVTCVPTWEFYKLPPGEYERILDEYDVLIFSDVEAKLFQLCPDMFDRRKFGKQVLTFPDRIRLTNEAVQSGLGVMFLGGWMSFTGELGRGGWGRTKLAEILPLQCLDIEDLAESSEGFAIVPELPDHPVLAGLDVAAAPPILGYNITRPRAGCEVVARFSETGDPAIAVGQFGSGRVFSYTSDPAPHWACNFVYWDEYAAFWQNACRWAAGQ
ncbi:hypothetical protein Mal52_45060 [Symmachiella dynata]|uniref:Putative glutamine amidotransferase domain-containing protein n=1 Tax=Symmachiella dynata TaxID=2527995 RepID=A0A517ZU69_9PLAN|nr:glutamine amidotransferase [Symmachiella dynata]QDU46009.1 hypothetical protein Mal52_45060 [Symmachiella dynata]